jgi:putative transposase
MVVRTVGWLLVRRLAGLVGLLGLGRGPDARDVEIAVLRHQLAVLERQVKRPRYAPSDRLLLAWLARLLPRERWSAFLVTPGTLLAPLRCLISARHRERDWALRAVGQIVSARPSKAWRSLWWPSTSVAMS